jgi:hypothetical protein
MGNGGRQVTRFMDCRASLSMNRLVIANPSTLRQAQDRLSSGQAAVKQSMTSEGMDRHGLRPRDDANNTVIASRPNPGRYRIRTLNLTPSLRALRLAQDRLKRGSPCSPCSQEVMDCGSEPAMTM